MKISEQQLLALIEIASASALMLEHGTYQGYSVEFINELLRQIYDQQSTEIRDVE